MKPFNIENTDKIIKMINKKFPGLANRVNSQLLDIQGRKYVQQWTLDMTIQDKKFNDENTSDYKMKMKMKKEYWNLTE